MKLQEAFNKSVNGVINQKKPSVISETMPAYRGTDGCRCPVGWLIDDSAYSEDMENIRISSFQICNPILDALEKSKVFPSPDGVEILSMLVMLQRAHDKNVSSYYLYSEKEWEHRFILDAKEVAKRFGLIFLES